MSRPHSVPPLPVLPGATARASAWDGVRVLLWTLRGYRYTVRKNPDPAARRYARTVLLVITVPLLVLPVAVAAVLHPPGSPLFFLAPLAQYALLALILLASLHRRSYRTYISTDRRAALTVRTTLAGWHVESFFTATPGTGAAAPLWHHVIPALLDAADAQQVTVTATAINATVAAHYVSRVPGLHPRPTQRPGPRVHLIRHPQPTRR